MKVRWHTCAKIFSGNVTSLEEEICAAVITEMLVKATAYNACAKLTTFTSRISHLPISQATQLSVSSCRLLLMLTNTPSVISAFCVFTACAALTSDVGERC